MNKGLRALKKASPKAYSKIMGNQAMNGLKNMMGMGGKMYAEGGMTQRNKGLFRGSEEENVYDDFGNIVGSKKKTSGLRGILGADEIHYDNDGNKVAKVNQKRNKTKVSFYEGGGMNVVKDYDMGGKMYDDGAKIPFGAASSGAAAGDSYRGLTTKGLLAALAGAEAGSRSGIGEEETLTDEEKVAQLASILRATGSLSPETVNDIRAAEGSDAMGYTTAVDNTAAPFLINPPEMTTGSMNRTMEPMEDMSPPQGISPMDPLQPSQLPVDVKMSLIKGDGEMSGLGKREDAGFITAPYLRTGQVPTNIRFRDPRTRQMKQRQMEPEEIANFIFENQNPSARKFDRDQAYQKALEIMRGRS